MNMMTNKEVGFADLLKNGQTLKQFRDDILKRTSCSRRSAAVWFTLVKPPRRLRPARSSSKKANCASRCTPPPVTVC